MNMKLIEKRKNILRTIRHLEKKLDKAQKEMDFEAFCNYSTAIRKHYEKVERLNELIVDAEELMYCVTGEYPDGTEIEKVFFDLDEARSVAGCIIEDGGFAHLTDSENNEYQIF